MGQVSDKRFAAEARAAEAPMQAVLLKVFVF
jgi:hypothetical protein